MRFLTLRYFHEVAKLGSIRRAADRLHVAPSAVSRQIATLEQELDAANAELWIVPEGGHAFTAVHAAAFNARVLSFLRSVSRAN